MNEEEKKAIEKIDYIQDFIIEHGQYDADINDMEYFSKILNLIKKQQKEIEDKKEEMYAIARANYIIGQTDERSLWFKKINEKIEKLEQEKKDDGLDYDWLRDSMISALQNLIGKEE